MGRKKKEEEPLGGTFDSLLIDFEAQTAVVACHDGVEQSTVHGAGRCVIVCIEGDPWMAVMLPEAFSFMDRRFFEVHKLNRVL